MRIGLVSTVSAPVRKDSGGSVEAWTWLLARELTRLGQQITIFGCNGSEANAEVIASLPGPYAAPDNYDDWQLCEWINLCEAVKRSSDFDVLHTQAYLWGIPLQSLSRAPLLHTLHIVPDNNAARLWERAPETRVTALSQHQWSAYPNLKPAAIIPHGVDISQFTFREKPDDYVLYLGRFTSGKGPIHAIRAAQHLGLRLLLAGPENPYFREKIKPLIRSGSIEYVGPVRGEERNKLLGGARALLYPIQYPEAFGLVLLEAMFCGTPIAAIGLGAVPEIIDEGVTGFCVASTSALPDAIQNALKLDRRRIRQQAEGRFSAERMAREYLAVYERMVMK